MKQQSLIFSDWSVRQILNGTKTQTRRVLKPQPSFHSSGEMTFLPNHDEWHLTPQQGKDDDRNKSQTREFAGGRLPPATLDVNEDLSTPANNFNTRSDFYLSHNSKSFFTKCKFQLGDIVWVREVWGLWGFGDNEKPVYRATAHLEPDYDSILNPTLVKWKSSILMPRKYSRLTLEIVKIKCERLQNISEVEVIAEGVLTTALTPIIPEFRRLWDLINGKTHPWSSNPFVWVLSFKIHKNGGSYGIQ